MARFRLSPRPALFGAALVMLLAELALRAIVAAGGLGSPYLLPDVQNGVIFEALPALSQHNPPDVVFLGSSQAQRGISPHVFDQHVQQLADGRAVTSFNFSIGGGTAVVTVEALELVCWIACPTTVIYALSTRDLSETQQAAYYERVFFASPVGQALAADSAWGQLQYWLLRNVYLIRYRDNLATLFFRGQTVRSGWPTDDRGYVSVPYVMTPEDLTVSLRVGAGEFAPFNFTARYRQAVERLIALTDEHDIALIFLNMPFHESMADAIPAEDYAEYVATLQEMSTQYAIPFWDFNSPDCAKLFPDDAFEDVVHLNQAGATTLSTALAELYAERQFGIPRPSAGPSACVAA